MRYISLYGFFSTSPTPTFFFLAFALFFLPLLSRFLSPCMPALQISAYRTKNASTLSASTTADNLILSARCSFDLPFVARMRIGNEDTEFKSGKNEQSLGGDGADNDSSARMTRFPPT